MTARTFSRRRFLKIAGLTLAGSSLACCGLGAAAALTTPKTVSEPVETPRYAFGKENQSMNPKILIVYATRTGSTPGVAAAIGETLAGRGYAVDVSPIQDDPDPAGYQAVIVGSAVNGGKWLPEAVAYIQRRQSALRQAPLAYFCVHILNRGSDEGSQKNRRAYLDEARALAAPSTEAFFCGKGFDPKDTSPILQWVLRATGFIPEGDCRDWAKIRSWGQSLFA